MIRKVVKYTTADGEEHSTISKAAEHNLNIVQEMVASIVSTVARKSNFMKYADAVDVVDALVGDEDKVKHLMDTLSTWMGGPDCRAEEEKEE